MRDLELAEAEQATKRELAAMQTATQKRLDHIYSSLQLLVSGLAHVQQQLLLAADDAAATNDLLDSTHERAQTAESSLQHEVHHSALKVAGLEAEKSRDAAVRY